jgi:hypothetical protein
VRQKALKENVAAKVETVPVMGTADVAKGIPETFDLLWSF